jgi:hypothetical protein
MPNKLLLTIATASSIIAAFAAAPAAHASTTQESVFQDDTALIFSGDAKRQQTLDDIKALGGTTIHSLVFWNRVAPNPNSNTRPSFDATNPDAYPPGAWGPYDALVAEAQARGLSVIFSPVQGPAWADTCRNSANRHHCKPSPKEYGQFFTALARRYPQVHRWSVWNEPNQSNWLYPQRERKHGHIIPTAAIVYRNLFRAATAALKANGHASDQMLLGETAPLGRTTGTLGKRFLSPVEFFQGVFCLDSRGHKLRGTVAKDEGCRGTYQRLAATGIAHHPYNRGGSQPPTRRPTGPGEITIANLSTLSSVINQGARAHRIRSGLPFYFTEFGFQTNPPDRLFGVSLSRQARYINESDYIAYHNSRVRAVAQYEMFDDPVIAVFQTGLRFKDGKAKPSYGAYRLPIWVTRSGSGVRVWGWVRPARGTAQTVQIQNGSRKFKAVKTVKTNSRGFFQVRVSHKPGPKWRFAWGGFTSRAAGIGT